MSPLSINSMSLLDAAKHYRSIGWKIHPCYAPTQGKPSEKGKRPKLTQEDRLELTDADLEKYFGDAGSLSNIGLMPAAPDVVVDLDSKADHGESVRRWLAEHPEIATATTLTGGGAHLHFKCCDLPEIRTPNGKAPAVGFPVGKIGDAISTEFFFTGTQNLILPPSVHKSGARYVWTTDAEPMSVSWSQLVEWFAFDLDAAQEKRKPGRPPKEPKWFARYRGDLRTLDLVTLLRDAGIYGKLADADDGKHTITCPWRDQHTGAAGTPAAGDTSTAVFIKDNTTPAFKCLHSHCSEKSIEHLLAWLETRRPGCVDAACGEFRVWAAGSRAKDGRPRVLLPMQGRPDSEFASEVGECLRNAETWFFKGGTVVQIKNITQTGKNDTEAVFTGFAELEPSRAITSVETAVQIGRLVRSSADDDSVEFSAVSMSREDAATLIAAPQLHERLPRVDRVFPNPLIVVDKETGRPTLPRLGHDKRLLAWTPKEALRPVDMSVEDGIGWIRELFSEFCFEKRNDDDEQNLTHAIAALLTPACRGVFARWTTRVPVFVYSANRPRSGKDYLAGLTGIVHEGAAVEDPAISNDDKSGDKANELRKKVTAALQAGRRRMHFSNCRGHLANSTLEQIITQEFWSDRILGGNEEATLPNELYISLSANIGLTFTPDFADRARFIRLFFAEENANARVFKRPDLHGWTMKHRPELLGALNALIKHWFQRGCPPGPTPFSSFPEWSRVVGGIMVACGLGDPCLSETSDEIGGDQETADMKRLFALAYEAWPGEWKLKSEIRAIVDDADNGLFGWLRANEKSYETRFALMLDRFVGRIFSVQTPDGAVRVRLDREPGALRAARRKYKFSALTNDRTAPDGRGGNFGNVALSTIGEVINYSNNNTRNYLTPSIAECADLPRLPRIPPYHIITNADERDDLAETLTRAEGALAVDIETYGDGKSDALDAYKGAVRLLTIKAEGQEPYIVDVLACGGIGALKGVLETAELIVHNAAFDLRFLGVHHGVKPSALFCTMTASRLLTNGTTDANDLGAVLRRHGIANLEKEHGRSDWGGMLFDDMLAYAADDVRHLHALRTKLETALAEAGLARVFDLESGLLPATLRMELAGVKVDQERLGRISADAKAEADRLACEIRKTLAAPDMNPSSPEQVTAALKAAGVDLANTTEETLKGVDHPAAGLLLDMRASEKLSQQAETLLDAVRSDGRIHARFEATGTETGRFSCRNPNLQNVGRGELRECVVAEAGKALVVADYSQIELRVAAALAGETKMIKAYDRGDDLHKATAAAVLGKKLDEVTKDDRQLAKAVNFGLIYGQSAPGLVRYAKASYGVDLTEAEAAAIRHKFFRNYKGLAAWHERTRAQAEKGELSETRTATGRRRLLPDIPGEECGKSVWRRFSAGLNTPVQGTAADGMKIALARLDGWLPDGARIIGTVHDEVIVECLENQIDRVRQLTEEAMRSSMSEIVSGVKIEVEAKSGHTWKEAK